MINDSKFESAFTEFQEGELEEAAKICREILATQPDHLDALHLLAILHYQCHEYNLAGAYCKKVLELDPDNHYAFFLLGNIFLETGDDEMALMNFQKAAEVEPSFADAFYNLGIIYEKSHQYENAFSAYKKTLSLNPDVADVNNNIGNLLFKMKKFDQAIVYLRKAIELNPNYVLALNNMGLVLKEMGLHDEAIHSLQRAIELEPALPDAYFSIALILKEKGHPDQAEENLLKAIAFNPSFADAYCNLAIILEEKGNLHEAIAYFRKALQIKPQDPEIHWNMSLTFLTLAEFFHGWREYEWRFLVEEFRQAPSSIPRWDGLSRQGTSLLVNAEQGIGEEIMFASCLPEIIAEADQCIIECDKRLIPLFTRSFPTIRATERLKADESYPFDLLRADMKIAVGSLPKFLRHNLSSFPQQTSYLLPDINTLEIWSKRFSALGQELKIGISWRGGGKPSDKHLRSTVLSQWKELFALPGVHFINLQYGDCSSELMEAKDTLGITIHDWEDADPLKDLDNFAAQIAALDLVISVDNATVHMAGALGVPVWVLLPFACDWRWMRDYEDTPWYKSVRLIRQEKAGDWDGVFQRAASDLKAYLETGLMPEITRSYKSSLSTGTTVHEPAAPLLSVSSGTTYRCAVITPIGPGHETLYTACLDSINKAFLNAKGFFFEIIHIPIDDHLGKLGRSKARNVGVKKASDQAIEWLFFIDADDLMAPSAFEYVSPYLNDYDGIWGSIWPIEKGEQVARERPLQLPFLYSIDDVLACDPFVTLGIGHFVKTAVALSTPFDESLNAGEDFDYYLRVWEKYRCLKIPLPLWYHRRGHHSQGPRAATGNKWRRNVEEIIKKYLQKRKVIS